MLKIEKKLKVCYIINELRNQLRDLNILYEKNPINDCKELDLMIKDTLNDLCERVNIDYRRFHMKESCKDYLSHSESKCFNEILFSFIDEKGVKDSKIYKKVDIDRKLFSKIRCSSDYIPRRNVIIKLCFALGLNKDDFNRLLNSAGYSLSSSKFDLIIAYCLDNEIYDINIINNYLYTYSNAVL